MEKCVRCGQSVHPKKVYVNGMYKSELMWDVKGQGYICGVCQHSPQVEDNLMIVRH